MKRYKIQELAEMLKPGQLGYSEFHKAFLFRPQSQFDPRVSILVEDNWDKIRGVDGVLRAYPTLENYYALEELGIDFQATQKLTWWKFWATNEPTSFDGQEEWQKDSPLFDYQADAARFLKSRQRAMLSLSPGLGKTLTSAYAAGLREFDNVLAVVPASLLYYWKSELEKWSNKLPMKPLPIIWHRKAWEDFPEGLEEDYTQLWAITNPETVARHLDKFLASVPFDCLICDESIMYKHRNSQRSKAMKSLAKSIETVWFLTGAPATRYLDDFWHQFHILKPKGYRSYWRFARKYCIVDDDDWGSKVVANKRDGEQSIKINFSDIYFARSQDEVADIPDWIFEDVDIPMHSAQEKIYHKLRNELMIELEEVEDNQVLTVNNHLALMIRSIQLASNPILVGAKDSSGKWDALPELMGIYSGPSLVWVSYIKTGEILRDRLGEKGNKVVLVNGSTSAIDRSLITEAYQRGKIDILIMNDQVGKFGFNLTRARTAYFLERQYNDSYFQCLHRNRRIGTTQSPIIVNMRSVYQNGHSTIDRVIHDVLDYRVGMIKEVTAGMLKGAFSNG